jgi:hypothetical protein
MPVPAQPRVNRHTGNGVTSSWAYGFRILNQADISVTIDDVVMVLNTDYAVTGVGSNGGTIQFTFVPANGAKIVIFSNAVYARIRYDYVRNGSFKEETVDADFDQIVIMIQQLDERFGRGLFIPITDVIGTNVELPAEGARAGKVLTFDSLGNVITLTPTDLNLSLVTPFIATLIDDEDAEAARATLGAGDFKSDGSVAMTGALTLSGDAIDPLHAVPLQQLEAAIAAIPAPEIPSSFLTGMGMDWWLPAAPAGWVFASGRTIGNAASGATERANADCEALFIALWNAYPNTILAVSGGRGASAAADWAANKTIALIDKRGRVSVGKDDMGGTVASRMTTAGAGIDGKVLGAAGGTQTHTLSITEMPSHNHPGSYGQFASGESGIGPPGSTGNPGFSSYSINVASQGGGAAHQNTQPSIVCNYIIKL